MTATIAQTVGVDIAKLTLDVYLHPQATTRQFPNTAAGITALLGWLGQTTLHRVVFEPTGAYHRGLERQLGDAGVPMVLSDTDAGAEKGALFDDSGELARLIGRPTTPFRTTITGFVQNQHSAGQAPSHA